MSSISTTTTTTLWNVMKCLKDPFNLSKILLKHLHHLPSSCLEDLQKQFATHQGWDQRVPDVLWNETFEFLQIKELGYCARVNHLWKKIVHTMKRWQKELKNAGTLDVALTPQNRTIVIAPHIHTILFSCNLQDLVPSKMNYNWFEFATTSKSKPKPIDSPDPDHYVDADLTIVRRNDIPLKIRKIYMTNITAVSAIRLFFEHLYFNNYTYDFHEEEKIEELYFEAKCKYNSSTCYIYNGLCYMVPFSACIPFWGFSGLLKKLTCKHLCVNDVVSLYDCDPDDSKPLLSLTSICFHACSFTVPHFDTFLNYMVRDTLEVLDLSYCFYMIGGSEEFDAELEEQIEKLFTQYIPRLRQLRSLVVAEKAYPTLLDYCAPEDTESERSINEIVTVLPISYSKYVTDMIFNLPENCELVINEIASHPLTLIGKMKATQVCVTRLKSRKAVILRNTEAALQMEITYSVQKVSYWKTECRKWLNHRYCDDEYSYLADSSQCGVVVNDLLEELNKYDTKVKKVRVVYIVKQIKIHHYQKTQDIDEKNIAFDGLAFTQYHAPKLHDKVKILLQQDCPQYQRILLSTFYDHQEKDENEDEDGDDQDEE